ncbi:hypothetical protein [Streptomyces sp. MJP52]|uniref:hypothetical protein n=1 Tax=Streptomyces sp. MJP52 TaxID=2940555 RepID=UPI0024758FA0|nr:hypothetical protein [Streptomyces sp. MJP52]MDH6223638.1 hypothetical protein [Streptomyces sp. MJP52]
MQHRRHLVRRSAASDPCGRGQSPSPLEELERAFLALARRPEPLMFPAHLVCEEPDRVFWPVDRVRAQLAHPSTPAELREQTWQEVIRRARHLGAPWDVAAVAMSVPVLRRILARLRRPQHLERAEMEQEALAGVATALRTVDLGDERPDRELFRAADRAVHRLVYAGWRQVNREAAFEAAEFSDARTPTTVGDDEAPNEFTVLAQAVQQRVLDVAEARLIARTRLAGEPMSRLAAERGVSLRQLYRHRNAAEQHLAAHLRYRLAGRLTAPSE